MDWLKTSLKQRADMMAAWVWLIPKSLIDRAGGWNPALSLNNDFEFSVRLLLQSDEILFVQNAKVFYRTNGKSLSATVSRQAYEAAFMSTYLGCKYLLEKDDSIEMRRICSNRYQEWIFRMYPNYPDVMQKFEEQVRLLGGSDIALEGGVALKTISSILGWKPAKRLKIYVDNILR